MAYNFTGITSIPLNDLQKENFSTFIHDIKQAFVNYCDVFPKCTSLSQTILRRYKSKSCRLAMIIERMKYYLQNYKR